MSESDPLLLRLWPLIMEDRGCVELTDDVTGPEARQCVVAVQDTFGFGACLTFHDTHTLEQHQYYDQFLIAVKLGHRSVAPFHLTPPHFSQRSVPYNVEVEPRCGGHFVVQCHIIYVVHWCALLPTCAVAHALGLTLAVHLACQLRSGSTVCILASSFSRRDWVALLRQFGL